VNIKSKHTKVPVYHIKKEKQANNTNDHLDGWPLAGNMNTDAGNDMWSELETGCCQLQTRNTYNNVTSVIQPMVPQ